MSERTRVALVTGAARGIGAATARRFAAAGYRVVGADVIEREAVEGVSDEWELVRCDVADETAVAELVARTSAAAGGIDVLVNVAGVVLVKPLEETTLGRVHARGERQHRRHVPALQARHPGHAQAGRRIDRQRRARSPAMSGRSTTCSTARPRRR